jgi:uncharacterized protein YqjF (DUF2071 family)
MPDSLRPLSVSLSDVYFVHWPVSAAAIDPLVPAWTEPDTFDGSAWVSAVAVAVDRFDTFGVPVREGVQSLNLRTYVTTPSLDRAVHFLSLDVNDRIAADSMRALFQLPTYSAELRRSPSEDDTDVVVQRRDGSGARLRGAFDPVGDPGTVAPDTLPSFLVNRERYVANGPFGTRLVGSVGHPPWRIQPADATLEDRTILDAASIEAVDDPPLVHYSPGLDMAVGRLEPL